MPHYAIARGRQPGVYQTWDEANQQVKGFSDAKYKKFNTEEEARAFVEQHGAEMGLVQTFASLGIKEEHFERDCTKELQEAHPGDLIAFCSGSAPRNGQEGCVASYAVSFPLEGRARFVMDVEEHPTNNRADCLAAQAATYLAQVFDLTGKKLVIYSRYEGLVHAMTELNGEARWIDKWKRNGWRTSKKEPVEHQDIYEVLLAAEKRRPIEWRFVDVNENPLAAWFHKQIHEKAECAARTH